MKEVRINIDLRTDYAFTLTLEDRDDKILTVLAVKNKVTGEILVERTYPSNVGAYSRTISRYVKQMFLEEYYQHPEIYRDDKLSNKTLSLLRGAYSTFNGNLATVLEKEHYLLSEIQEYVSAIGTTRKCHVETRRYSATLITRTYRFLKGNMITSPTYRVNKRLATQTDRECELVLVKHFRERQPLASLEEVYLQHSPLVEAFIHN